MAHARPLAFVQPDILRAIHGENHYSSWSDRQASRQAEHECLTFNKSFASIAHMKDEDAAATLLFLRSKGYRVWKLAVLTGMSEADIERLLSIGICKLTKMQ